MEETELRIWGGRGRSRERRLRAQISVLAWWRSFCFSFSFSFSMARASRNGPLFFFLLTNIWNSQLLCDSHSPHRQKRTLSRLVLCLLRETKNPLPSPSLGMNVFGDELSYMLPQLQTRLYIFPQRPFCPLFFWSIQYWPLF